MFGEEVERGTSGGESLDSILILCTSFCSSLRSSLWGDMVGLSKLQSLSLIESAVVVVVVAIPSLMTSSLPSSPSVLLAVPSSPVRNLMHFFFRLKKRKKKKRETLSMIVQYLICGENTMWDFMKKKERKKSGSKKKKNLVSINLYETFFWLMLGKLVQGNFGLRNYETIIVWN